MQRRAYLGVVAAGLAAGIAGCQSEEGRTETTGHPFAADTVTVAIDDDSKSDHDLETVTREALDFWERESEQYAGFETAFELGTAADAALVVSYIDGDLDCDGVSNEATVLGCAPLIESHHSVETPVTAHVVAGDRPMGMIQTTTKHEIGHVLGLAHDDEPQEIMSNEPRDRIPAYDRRVEIWEHVVESQEHANEAIEQFNDGIEAWDDEQYEPAGEQFEPAVEAFEQATTAIERAQADANEFDEQTETLESDRLERQLNRLRERMRAGKSFTAAMQDAAAAAADDEFVRAAEKQEQGSEKRDEYQTIDTPSGDEIVTALGLVQTGDETDKPTENDEPTENE